MERTTNGGNFPGRVLACLLIAACLVIGLVGIVLPIIPGLLFLVVALVIAARHFPAFGARLRRHPALRRHLRRADGFAELGLGGKIRLAGWYCAKVLVQGLAAAASAVEGLRTALARKR